MDAMIRFIMQLSYIKSKLFIPFLRRELVSRDRLFKKLDQGFSERHSLILVCAPAGYGKTTLVRSWLETSSAPVAWYSLEHGDDNPQQFLIYLINALQYALDGEIGTDAEFGDSFSTLSTDVLLALCLNQITEYDQPLLLVLDDLHNIKNKDIHTLISELIFHLPKKASLVITTRVEPELPLSRMRARNQITEIRTTDLRFNLEESEEFFLKTSGIALPKDLMVDLDKKTEGWVVGLQLAALRFNENSSDMEAFIRHLNGNSRLILGYLLDEVLEEQPPNLKSFLFQTVLLDKFNAGLSASLLNISPRKAQLLISTLERKNLFIYPVDQNREWYRYHPLFSDILQARLRETTPPEKIAELQLRASRWFEDQGLNEKAIQYCAASGDDERTLGLIQANAEKMLLSGKYDLFLRYAKQIPEEHLSEYPKIALFMATAMLFREYPKQEIESLLKRIERSHSAASLSGEIMAVRAIIKNYTNSPQRGIDLSKKAMVRLNRNQTFFRNIVERNLGVAYTLQNDLKNANIWFENLLLSSHELGDWGGVLAAYNYLTYIRKVQGRLHEASIIYKKALNFIDEKRLDLMPHSIKIIAGFGQLLLNWHRVDEAKTYFKKAISLAKKSDILYAFTAYHNLSRALALENDFRNALAVIHEARQLTQGKNDLYFQIHQDHSEAAEARIHLEAGRIERAYAWVLSKDLMNGNMGSSDVQFGFELGFILPITARILITKGFYDQTITMIEPVIPQYIHQGAHAFLIRALNALAIAYYLKGEKERALHAIDKSIQFAEPEDNLGDFLYFRHLITELLYKAMASGIAPDFIGKILSLSNQFDTQQKTGAGQLPMMDPLSPREMDVLSLISKGMSNQEIANTLFLSKNTIKSHNINIYRKLNVNNRNQAVCKAQLLGILPGKQQGYTKGPHYR